MNSAMNIGLWQGNTISLANCLRHSLNANFFISCSYEPELHPGATYRIKDLKAVLKIFQTGSITITAPSVPNVQLAVEHIYPLVYEFRKPKPRPAENNSQQNMCSINHLDDDDHKDALMYDKLIVDSARDDSASSSDSESD